MQDKLKERISLLEELLKQKISQANSLKESMKPIEAYSVATKELSKKIEDIVLPKKQESLELLSKQQMSGEFFRFLFEILDQVTGSIRHTKLDIEKLLLSKQHELNFISQEFNKIKELQGKLSAELSRLESAPTEEKREEQKPEYVRPDQNPNTRIGKASIDLQQRKKAGKISEEDSVAGEKA